MKKSKIKKSNLVSVGDNYKLSDGVTANGVKVGGYYHVSKKYGDNEFHIEHYYKGRVIDEFEFDEGWMKAFSEFPTKSFLTEVKSHKRFINGRYVKVQAHSRIK